MAARGVRDVLAGRGIPTALSLSTSYQLPFDNDQFDVVLSFYSLEHLRPIRLYLAQISRVLRPGGIFAGAIPTEGGLAWGVGRFLTSRRYVRQRIAVDLNKLVCWEHQNFADAILSELHRTFQSVSTTFWPLGVPIIDLNLIADFLCVKRPS